jgi:hypothetical protein
MRTEDIKKMGQAYLQVLEKSQKEAMDAVNKKALKKDFDDREDKDIDNDGDEDESDEYLHKKRKAISKAIEKLVKHDCATHVEHAEFGEGVCIPGEHTLVESSDGEGYVTHYDVMFDHGLEKDVMVEDLKITKSEAHIHAGKKMKKESVEIDEKRDMSAPPVSAKVIEDDGFRLVMKFKDGTTEALPSIGRPSMQNLKGIVDKNILKNPKRKAWVPVVSAAMKKGLVKEEVEIDEFKVNTKYTGKGGRRGVSKKEIRELEKWNEHGLVALKLAQAYGTPAEVSFIKDINKRHEKNNEISAKDQKDRDAITRKYYKMAESVEIGEAATAQTKPDEKTRDTYEKQLSTRKGEKDFVDQHKSEVPVAADEPKIDAMNFKTFKAMTKKSPARSADQTKGDTKIIPSATPVKEDADQLDEISVGLAKRVLKKRADNLQRSADKYNKEPGHQGPTYGNKDLEKKRMAKHSALSKYADDERKFNRSSDMLAKKSGGRTGKAAADKRFDATPSGKYYAYKQKGGKLSRDAYDKRFGNR